MKMIDVSEVEDLNRAQMERDRNDAIVGGASSSLSSSVQARKLERKRKLLEDAAASGLRNRDRKKTTTSPGDGEGAAEGADVSSVPPSEGNNGAMMDQQSQ